MTRDDLRQVLDEYSAGFDSELSLLHQLCEVAQLQHQASTEGNFAALDSAGTRRDEIMRCLVVIEESQTGRRRAITDHRDLALRLDGFTDVAARHREATRLVNDILSTDKAAMSALADIELARRSALAGLERGEATLAGYRRVLAPPAPSATLVNRRG